jgi:adenosylcobinamide-GDP ribazoletransferase
VAGLALLLLVKFTAIWTLVGGIRMQALFLAPMLARWAQVQLAFGSERARKDEASLASPFLENLKMGGYVAASLSAVAAAVLVAGPKGLGAMAAAGVVALGARFYFAKRLGGVTGDTIGATSEVCEAAAFVAFAAMV